MENENILKGKKVMWVEDDLFLSSLLSKKFSTHGCILEFATTGQGALDAMKKEVPDILILDVMLPGGLDGFEVLRQMKADEVTKNVPVVLFSNLNQEQDVEKGMKLGAARFIIKATVVLDDIIREVQKVLFEKETKR